MPVVRISGVIGTTVVRLASVFFFLNEAAQISHERLLSKKQNKTIMGKLYAYADYSL